MGQIAEAFDLSGRVAVITGAARGIGRAGAAILGEAGAHIVIVDVLAAAARSTQTDLADAGVSCECAVVDVADQAAVNALVADIVARHGRLDVMVNNAAIISESSPLNVTEEEIDRIHAVNFKGVVFGSQAAARVMIGQGKGSIINMASGAIDVATPVNIAYATAKAAVAQYSRSLALELSRKGVRVNTIAPGWVDTPMNERHVLSEDGSVDPERKAKYVEFRANMSALGIPGRPEDQAFAMLYLASDASRFVTGTVMRPNGGGTMPW
jgi:3-oxoacyl-[acyl-carrier protein] reductase